MIKLFILFLQQKSCEVKLQYITEINTQNYQDITETEIKDITETDIKDECITLNFRLFAVLTSIKSVLLVIELIKNHNNLINKNALQTPSNIKDRPLCKSST